MPKDAGKKTQSLAVRSGAELWQTTDDCFFTLPTRKQYYEELRSWYWHGADNTAEDAEINRIFGEINNILSLTYSPEQIILEGLVEGPTDSGEMPILQKLTRTVRDNFFYRRLDVQSSQVVLNSFIDGCSFVKPVWKGGGVSWQETPADHIGVMFEALPINSEFQIFATETELTEIQVKTWWPDVYKQVKAKKASETKENQGQLEVILGGQGSTSAQINTLRHVSYNPQSSGDTFKCRQLWSFEHSVGQWRKATLVEGVKVSDDLTGRHDHPYIHICPIPVTNWLWGHSFVRMIKYIQASRNRILGQIDEATERLLDPSLLITGYNIGETGAEDAVARLKRPGGHYILNGNGVKAEPWTPKLEIKAAYEQIDFRDLQTKFITGVNEIMQGQSQRNVRSQGYASMLAQFASTELKRVAHFIEAQLEEAFTFTGKLFQENDKTQYKDDKTGRTFYLAQFPFDYRLEIYGHTGSPIATENNINLSMQLSEKGLMPPEILIDLLPIPYKDQLKDYAAKQQMLKQTQQSQGQQQPEQHQAKGHKVKQHSLTGDK